MNKASLRETLLTGKVYGKKEALEVARQAATSPAFFEVLITCLLSREYRVSQRAAWSVSWAVRENPSAVVPHIPEIVACFLQPDAPGAVIRNCAVVLQDIVIPDAYHGAMMNACFDRVIHPETPPAIKANALTILYNLSVTYGDIRQELKMIIKEQWEKETAAFRSRGKKILSQLNQQA